MIKMSLSYCNPLIARKIVTSEQCEYFDVKGEKYKI